MSSLFQHATHSKTFPGVRLWLPPAPCPLTSALTARWLSTALCSGAPRTGSSRPSQYKRRAPRAASLSPLPHRQRPSSLVPPLSPLHGLHLFTACNPAALELPSSRHLGPHCDRQVHASAHHGAISAHDGPKVTATGRCSFAIHTCSISCLMTTIASAACPSCT